MGDFEEKLESILNNPQAMSQIMSLAQSLGASAGAPEAPQGASPAPPDDGGIQLDPRLLTGFASLLNRCNRNDDQNVALLQALKPFVKEDRCAKLDKAIRITRLSRMARMALELFRSEEE